MKCYCVYVRTARCTAFADDAARITGARVIYPQTVQHTWSHGKMTDIVHPLTPGYVFFYAEAAVDLMSVRRIEGYIRSLRGEDGEYELSGGDRDFAMAILACGGIVGRTEVYREGDMIRLNEGLFAGVPATILRVNRRNSRMQLEIPFGPTTIRTWVEYEEIKRRECCGD